MKKASGITSIGKKAFTKIQAKAKITVPAKKLKIQEAFEESRSTEKRLLRNK